MVVIDPDAIHGHATVMIIASAASVTSGAVMHPWELIHETFLAKPPSTLQLGTCIITSLLILDELQRKLEVIKE